MLSGATAAHYGCFVIIFKGFESVVSDFIFQEIYVEFYQTVISLVMVFVF